MDKDYVLQSVPCTFSDSENVWYMMKRPKACREFPHTDRKQFQQITDLTENIPVHALYRRRNEEEIAS
jgi:Fe-S-cluster containining protein